MDSLSKEVSLFLTGAELLALTGYQGMTNQRKWLEARGWSHEVNAIGRPVVSRAYCEKRLGVSADSAVDRTWSPNIAAIRAS